MKTFNLPKKFDFYSLLGKTVEHIQDGEYYDVVEVRECVEVTCSIYPKCGYQLMLRYSSEIDEHVFHHCPYDGRDNPSVTGVPKLNENIPIA